MKANLFKQLLAANHMEGDERQAKEMNRVLSLAFNLLCSALIVYVIIIETIGGRFGFIMPFALSQQIMFIIGISCFICSISLCKKGLIVASGSFTILFSAMIFPSFLLSEIPLVVFKSYVAYIAIPSILIVPLFIFLSYLFFNSIYKKSLCYVE
ncbi:hypothetical protein [Clostridium sp.]|uniref:hypothetical protein n=1 Tax=Clostridium sp. TaxID=1506 RepID=UPI003D6C9B6C